MRHSIKRDLKIRKQYAVREDSYLKLKSIFENRYLEGSLREVAGFSLRKKGGSLVKIQNRCVLSGRGRGILKKFKVSRMTFKELCSQGELIGLKKSSW